MSRPIEVLLVESDADVAASVVRQLESALWCNVTTAESAADAVREELTARHDVLVIALALPDAPGLRLARELRTRNPAPIVLLGDSPRVEEAVDGLRLGAADLLSRPLDLPRLTEVVRHAGEAEIGRRRQRLRQRRLRRVASQIIRERRDVQQRIELVCRDFVQAYRRLAERVSNAETPQRRAQP